MNIYAINKSKFFSPLVLLALALFSLAITGCDAKLVAQDEARILIANVIPQSKSMLISIDSINRTASALPFTASSVYFPIGVGNKNIEVTDAISKALIVKGSGTCVKDKFYSFWVINTVAQPEYIFMEDPLTISEDPVANIRFAHLSPTAPAVDLRAANSTTNLYSNLSYKSFSSFLPLPSNIYQIEVYEAGTNNKLATFADMVFLSKKIQTLAIVGDSITGIKPLLLNNF